MGGCVVVMLVGGGFFFGCVKGVCCYGYFFYLIGKLDVDWWLVLFEDVKWFVFIYQGDWDLFGIKVEFDQVYLLDYVLVIYLEDGNYDFGLCGKLLVMFDGNIMVVVFVIVDFVVIL